MEHTSISCLRINFYGKTPSAWDPYGIGLNPGDLLELDIDQNGYVTGRAEWKFDHGIPGSGF